uniref:Copper-fist domain-containing protein n=1 Tax=Haemonchus contortus TaxID=6289 RepID=A0A7I4YSJ1_HAECO
DTKECCCKGTYKCEKSISRRSGVDHKADCCSSTEVAPNGLHPDVPKEMRLVPSGQRCSRERSSMPKMHLDRQPSDFLPSVAAPSAVVLQYKSLDDMLA